MSPIIPGLELSRRFYEEIVRPLLDEAFPDLPYAAALLGPGSEVLGFDTARSSDHDWGARLFIFLHEGDARRGGEIATLLSQRLPPTFVGAPVHFGSASDEPRTRFMMPPIEGPIKHRVIPMTLRHFLRIQLGFEIDKPLQVAGWLTCSSSALGEFTAGAIYHDGIGEVTSWRQRLAWYPHDCWLYLMASGWQRIGQEEHLMPRAGEVGDELGSALIGSRLVRDVMRLCFLMERRYAPYPKWLGTAFRKLQCAGELWPPLWQAQQAATWQEREAALSQAYAALARMHNRLGLSRRLPESTSPFYDRPFQVIHGGEFAAALVKEIRDAAVLHIVERGLIGNIDLWSDNTDLGNWERASLRRIYEQAL